MSLTQGARYRDNRSKNLVGFVVGPVRYAVDILRVREILNPLALVELPHAPDSVLGVADHRGQVIPIIDLRLRFGLPRTEPTRRTKWIVVTTRDRTVGFVVDAVTDVFGAGGSERRDAPELGVGDTARGIRAVFHRGEGLVFVLDIERVAAPAEGIDITSGRPAIGELERLGQPAAAALPGKAEESR